MTDQNPQYSHAKNAGTVRPSMLALLSASFAFLFYGGWGYWVNIEYGHEMALAVLLAQGSYSFVLTLIMTLLIEFLYAGFVRAGESSNWSQAKVSWSTIIVSCAIVFSGSWLVNVYAGTPEIFKTVVLGYLIGGIYTYGYVFGINKRAKAAPSNSL